jgi:hypothetical protein
MRMPILDGNRLQADGRSDGLLPARSLTYIYIKLP